MDEQQMLQQMLQQIVALVLMAMLGDLQATLQIQEIMLSAKQGNQQAMLLALMILAEIQKQTPQMRLGAKIEYLKYLKGKCPQGYEMKMFKVGGKVCKKCMKKSAGGPVENDDPVTAFKCGHKLKKKK